MGLILWKNRIFEKLGWNYFRIFLYSKIHFPEIFLLSSANKVELFIRQNFLRELKLKVCSKTLKEIGYNHFGKFIIERKNSHKLGFIS